jgi:hypothetical protein
MPVGVPTRRQARKQLFCWSINRIGLLAAASLCLWGILYRFG